MHISLLSPCHCQHKIYHISKSCHPPPNPIMWHLTDQLSILLDKTSLVLLANMLVTILIVSRIIVSWPPRLSKYMDSPCNLWIILDAAFVVPLPMTPKIRVLTFPPTHNCWRPYHHNPINSSNERGVSGEESLPHFPHSTIFPIPIVTRLDLSCLNIPYHSRSLVVAWNFHDLMSWAWPSTHLCHLEYV